MTVKQSFHEWVLLVQNIFKIFHVSTFASTDRFDLVCMCIFSLHLRLQ